MNKNFIDGVISTIIWIKSTMIVNTAPKRNSMIMTLSTNIIEMITTFVMFAKRWVRRKGISKLEQSNMKFTETMMR